MKFKPASSLVLYLQKALHGISSWSGRQAMEPCCPLVVRPRRIQGKHIEDYITALLVEPETVQRFANLTWCYYCSSLMSCPASFIWFRQRNPIVTQLFKFKNLSGSCKNCTFLCNNKMNYLKIPKN